jgi:hypothetical protein
LLYNGINQLPALDYNPTPIPKTLAPENPDSEKEVISGQFSVVSFENKIKYNLLIIYLFP